ncbi:unnamed protein product [Strongylus vulgaris]|uniref:VWFA domain-containing protein n=1 Tax=Strongylus vulgaris TaxID=40348 RepID=A0A3P7IPC2_STRVU|nr:unnamed protein product [Strongylus vulgaris]
MDLVLVLDFSTTTDPLVRYYKELCQRLINALKIGPHYTQVAVVTFATVGRTRTRFNLKKYKTQADVLRAVADLESTGGTTAIVKELPIVMQWQEFVSIVYPVIIEIAYISCDPTMLTTPAKVEKPFGENFSSDM